MTLKQRLARAQRARRSNQKYAKARGARIKTLAVKLSRRPKLAYWLIDRHPGLRFASGFRTKVHNAEVGGVPNSWHTKGSAAAPGAIDLVGPREDMKAASADAREHVPGLAENLIHDVGSGLHLHLGGTGVIAFDFPEEADLRRLKRRRDRNRRAVKALTKQTTALKKAIAARQPVKAKGIDVSMHQGDVDWRKVKAAGYDFAWIKASEGGTFVDPRFLINVRRAKAAGLKVGAYHFVRPQSGRNGAVEAAFFHKQLKAAGLGKGDLIPILDVEVPGSTGVAPYVREALDHLESLTGHKVGIYTFPFFQTSWPAWARRTPLWIAHYDVAAPRLPKPWTKYAAWQHTSKGGVPGIFGNVDKNVAPDLRKLIA